ncbi:MAG: hypothetical protein JW937_05185 [Candidatus Omnitrophica bacterium]|nr:hypothetical protein [Candidatus Omnitrophota bacterium]
MQQLILDYTVMEAAKLESALCGVLTGFALTIVVLIVQQWNVDRDLKHRPARMLIEACLNLFVTAFFGGLLSSYLYVFASIENQFNERAAFCMLPGSVTMMLTCILFLLGISRILAAYSHSSNVLKISNFIAYTGICSCLLFTTYGTVSLYTVMHGTDEYTLVTTGSLLRILAFLGPYPMAISALALFFAHRVAGPRKSASLRLRNLNPFLVCVVLLCIVMGTALMIGRVLPNRLFGNIPLGVMYAQELLMCVMAGWAFSFVPNSRPPKVKLGAGNG